MTSKRRKRAADPTEEMPAVCPFEGYFCPCVIVSFFFLKRISEPNPGLPPFGRIHWSLRSKLRKFVETESDITVLNTYCSFNCYNRWYNWTVSALVIIFNSSELFQMTVISFHWRMGMGSLSKWGYRRIESWLLSYNNLKREITLMAARRATSKKTSKKVTFVLLFGCLFNFVLFNLFTVLRCAAQQ